MGASRFLHGRQSGRTRGLSGVCVHKNPLFFASSIPFPPVPVYCAKALPAVQGLPAA